MLADMHNLEDFFIPHEIHFKLMIRGWSALKLINSYSDADYLRKRTNKKLSYASIHVNAHPSLLSASSCLTAHKLIENRA